MAAQLHNTTAALELSSATGLPYILPFPVGSITVGITRNQFISASLTATSTSNNTIRFGALANTPQIITASTAVAFTCNHPLNTDVPVTVTRSSLANTAAPFNTTLAVTSTATATAVCNHNTTAALELSSATGLPYILPFPVGSITVGITRNQFADTMIQEVLLSLEMATATDLVGANLLMFYL